MELFDQYASPIVDEDSLFKEISNNRFRVHLML